MTRYTHHARTAALAGLLSAAAFAFSAAPAGAILICPAGTSNPAYCSHVPNPIRFVYAHRFVAHSTRRHQHQFTVTVGLRTRATVTISLLFRGNVVTRFPHKSTTRQIDQQINAPSKTGKYEIRVVARTDLVTQTVTQTIIVF